MTRSLVLLFGVILLLALAGYVLHGRMRSIAYLLWGVSLLLIVMLLLALAKII